MRHPILEEDLKRIVAAPLPWKDFENSTVLISGAAGFLPAYIAHTLLYLNETQNLGCTILALVRSETKARKQFSAYADRADLQFIEQDVCEPIQSKSKIDFIIHAASPASPKYYGVDPIGTIEANISGARNLLILAEKNPIRGFLFFSSGEVYGQVAESIRFIGETDYGYIDPTQLRSCYAEGKRAAETLCVSYHHQKQIPCKIVRPFHTYGPGMALDDGRVFADFVADIVAGRNIEMKSDGAAVRAFCYLTDATIGFFTVLLKGASGQAYNVGNDTAESSILNLAETLVALFPEKGLQVVKTSQPAPKGYLQSPLTRNCPNIAKLRGLGWKPETTIEDGFSRTIKFYTS